MASQVRRGRKMNRQKNELAKGSERSTKPEESKTRSKARRVTENGDGAKSKRRPKRGEGEVRPSTPPRLGPCPTRGISSKWNPYWMQDPSTRPKGGNEGPTAGPWPHNDGRMQG